ncbi:MAG: TVP38/TMEM64 family protein [Halomonas subglaciescola]|nr:TVP38/TMEM64 family protein [Halomonas subglaciescola]
MTRSLYIALGALLLLLALGGLWQWLTLNDVLTVERVRQWVATAPQWREAPWAFAAVGGIYVAALAVMFPLSILVAVTGLVFGPLWGFVYATLGTLCSSMVSYAVGKRLGHEALLSYGGRRLNGLSRYLAGRGVRSMVIVNLLPLAPFTLTNMLAGAFHLRFRDYMVGSTLGIVPGLAGVTLLGSQLGALATAGGYAETLWALGGLAVGAALLYALRRYAKR